MMIKIPRNIVVCQPMNFFRSNSIIRLAGSLPQQQRKESPLTMKDLVIDPNLVQAFEKVKKGDLKPISLDADSLKHRQKPSSMNINGANRLIKCEELRQQLLGKLVYIGRLDKPFKVAKSLSLTSSIGGALCYPLMLLRILEETSTLIAFGYTIITAMFVLLTPSLMQLICKRYLTSLYYHEQTEQFTGFYKNFFMIEKQIKFRAEDVQVPPLTGIFTSMLIHNKPFFVNHTDFYDKTILFKMLGYDKDFDFSKYTKDTQNDDDDNVNTNDTKRTK